MNIFYDEKEEKKKKKQLSTLKSSEYIKNYQYSRSYLNFFFFFQSFCC